MPTFNANDIIGKTLIAKKAIDIVRSADDSAQSVYEVSPGESVGVVYSYLLPNNARSNIYWMFEDNTGRPYYVKHGVGKFDIKTIQSQGALTLEEKQEQAEAASETITNKVFRYAKNGFLIAAAAYIVKSIIDSQAKK
jgi:hypothetical protein